MSKLKFYRCEKCGNLHLVLDEGGCVPTCCGQPMTELVAGTSDGAAEKHVPAISYDGDKMVVTVGEVEHPMLEEHHIEFVALAAEDKTIIKYLKPGEKPQVTFCKHAAEHGTIYEFCNLHGLWSTEF